jgi:hypothetical protein
MESVFDLIISPEVREFCKANVVLNIYGKEQLILHSFIPLEQKIKLLRDIETEGNRRDAHQICRMREYLQHCLDEIYHPSARSIFAVEYNQYFMEGVNIDCFGGIDDYFETVGEIITKLEEIYGGKDGTGDRRIAVGTVHFLQFSEGKKHTEIFNFRICWLGETWQVKDIEIVEDRKTDKAEQEQIAGESVIERLCEKELRHPLPFAHGSRVKLQLPFMGKPFVGYLYSGLDDNGAWQHFLYPEDDPDMLGTSYIDLSCGNADPYGAFNSWDWIAGA